ncbi:MAG: cation-transporting P-type ATPase [Candidatus Woesearchaeota archaeon]
MIGLTTSTAQELLKKFGPNDIGLRKKPNPFIIFLNQFKDIVIYILLFSAFLSFLIQETFTSWIIILIVLMIAILGFIQEFSSEKAMEELEKIITPEITVFRDNVKRRISVYELVPGDVIELKQGDIVPADCTVIKSEELFVNESVITGESTDVCKKAISVDMSLPLQMDKIQEDESFLYAGSTVTVGSCVAVVVKTGKNTELGKIAKHLREKKDRSIYHQHFEKLSKKVSVYIIFAIIFIFILRIVQGGFSFSNISHAIIFAIAIAVAAIPEGLPIVVTISFALSAKRMAKKNAIIRKFSVIDNLGSLTTICTDKTGTLTKNQLKVKDVFVYGKPAYYDIKKDNPFLETLYFSQNADVIRTDKEEKILGNSIDVAIFKFLRTINFRTQGKIIRKSPFDPTKKYSMNIVEIEGKKITAIKGAPENVLKMCTYVRSIEYREKILSLNKSSRSEIEKMIDFYAENGYHTIGFAKIEDGKTIFMGLIAFEDEIREEVREAVKTCYDAGINIIIVTGDHLKTAKKIAEEAGITVNGTLTGEEISKMSDDELMKKIKDVTICARVKPEDKYRIVEALKKNGEIVAMTGDGVNDAPALKKADVGIAVGSGTQVAIQASDVVLKDNNFVTLVEAIKEGRFVFFNLRKYLGFQFSINVAEILLILLAVIFFLPNPITAVQLLFINIILDDIVGISLTQLSPVKDLIKKKPFLNLLQKPLPQLIFSFGSLIAILSFLVFNFTLKYGIEAAQNFTFLALGFLGVLRVISFTNLKQSFIRNFIQYKEISLNSIIALLFLICVYLVLFFSKMPPYFFLIFVLVNVVSVVLQDIIKKIFVKEEFI